MTASAGRSANLAPNLTILKTSRSIRRSLISGPADSPSGLSGKSCPTTPSELPVLSRSKTGGDEYGSPWAPRISWFACVVLASLVVLMILSTNPLSHDWKSFSSSCPGAPSSLSSPLDDTEAVLVSGNHRSQDDRSGEESTPAQSGHDSVVQEDDKCWSRTGHLKYRHAERRSPPSPLLNRALEEYASLHARCTAGKNWESVFTGTDKSVGGNDSCKYLMYVEGTEGLGNRLISLVTAFAYAVVTDRVLLLDSRRNISGLICEPFQGSSWTMSTTFPFEKVDALPTLDNTAGEDLEKMAAVRLNLRHVQSQRDQGFFCGDVQERLGKVPWIAWVSNQYYVTRLFTMPAFWEKLNPLFDDPSRAFTQLSRYLLLPQNAIWAKTERIYSAYLAASQKLIGIQVRTPHVRKFEQSIQDRMMRCLLGDLILPKINKQRRTLGKADKNANIEEGTSIFVASLQREYYEGLKQVYAERGTEDGSFVAVHTMASDELENNSYDQSVKAFVDMWLLSFSDSLVTSGWSTFGYVAQGLGAVHPYIINTDVDQPSSCYMGQSVEPCTHFPFLSSCLATTHNVSAEHEEWTKMHLRACQDEPEGLQLVAS